MTSVDNSLREVLLKILCLWGSEIPVTRGDQVLIQNRSQGWVMGQGTQPQSFQRSWGLTMRWAQLAAEKELRYGPTLPAPNSLSHLLKGISQGYIFYPDDFPRNLLKASPGWGLRSNATFLEARVHLPPLLSLPSTPVSLSFCYFFLCYELRPRHQYLSHCQYEITL